MLQAIGHIYGEPSHSFHELHSTSPFRAKCVCPSSIETLRYIYQNNHELTCAQFQSFGDVTNKNECYKGLDAFVTMQSPQTQTN